VHSTHSAARGPPWPSNTPYREAVGSSAKERGYVCSAPSWREVSGDVGVRLPAPPHKQNHPWHPCISPMPGPNLEPMLMLMPMHMPHAHAQAHAHAHAHAPAHAHAHASSMPHAPCPMPEPIPMHMHMPHAQAHAPHHSPLSPPTTRKRSSMYGRRPCQHEGHTARSQPSAHNHITTTFSGGV
jgi:hypothetical protein